MWGPEYSGATRVDIEPHGPSNRIVPTAGNSRRSGNSTASPFRSMGLSRAMADQFAPDNDRRLSTLDGLIEAGIIEAFLFNPFTGYAGLSYTPNWTRILQARMMLAGDPIFNSAILDDDPVQMRAFVEREAARLAAEDAAQETHPRKRPRRPKARR